MFRSPLCLILSWTSHRTVVDSEFKEIKVSSRKNNRLPMRLKIYEDVSFVQLATRTVQSVSLRSLFLLAAKFPKWEQFFVQCSIYERIYWMRTSNSQNICQIRNPRLFSLLQELSNQFPCGLCFFLWQSFQNVNIFLSNVPYMRGFTECELTTLRTLAKYRIQTYFFSKWRSSAMYKIRYTVAGIFPIA